MPNWCANEVTMRNIGSLVKRGENGKTHFSFNEILPMPESLNVTAGSSNEEDVYVYLTDKCRLKPLQMNGADRRTLLGVTNKHFMTTAEYKKRCEKMDQKELDEAFERGKVLVNNLRTYGAMHWYDWRRDHWGTKWDACEPHLIDENTISFDTAWNPPEGVLAELSRQNPGVTITDVWEEEGGQYGTLKYLNGECILEESGTRSWDECKVD